MVRRGAPAGARAARRGAAPPTRRRRARDRPARAGRASSARREPSGALGARRATSGPGAPVDAPRRWVVALLRSPTRAAALLAGAAVAGDLGGLGDDEVLAYLGAPAAGGPDRAAAAARVRARCSDGQAKLLNLYDAWLGHLLPFALGRVDRVHYGLLSAGDVARARARAAAAAPRGAAAARAVPKARRLLAVPFVGKDRPSDASEFSHPDVLIGLTILAVRHEGLRDSDALWVLGDLQRRFRAEAGPAARRPAARAYARYVEGAGGAVRGARAGGGGVWPVDALDLGDGAMVGPAVALLRRSVACGRDYLWRRCFPETLTIRPSKLAASGQELGGAAIFGARVGFSGTPNDLVPAELGPCAFEAATDGRVARVLGDARVVARVALEAGWTPASLLGRVAREARAPYRALVDAGALVTGLSNREAAAALLAGGLGHCDGVLYFDEEDRPRVARRGGDDAAAASPVAAARRFTFYDHAHCTGLDVAQAADCRGALTLSKDSTYRDLAQAAFRLRRLGAGQTLALLVSPELAGCLAEARAAPRAAVAAALGDDAAWPALLRELLAWLAANGLRRERVNFFLLAEQSVANVARKASRRAGTERRRRDVAARARGRVRPRLAPVRSALAERPRSIRTSAETTSASPRSRGATFRRTGPRHRPCPAQVAHRELLGRHRDVGDARAGSGAAWLRACLDVFRTRGPRAEPADPPRARARRAPPRAPPPRVARATSAVASSRRRPRRPRRRASARGRGPPSRPAGPPRRRVAFDVENAVPAPRPCSERIAQLVEEHADLMTDAPDFGAAQAALAAVSAAEAAARAPRAGGAAAAFEGLQEREAEEEAEEEQAQEREQERRVEAEAEAGAGAARDAAEPQAYARDGEAPEPWPVAALRAPPGPGHAFYALADLRVAGDGAAAAVAFPRELRASPNYYRRAWGPGPPRRLRNVAVVLEYDAAPAAAAAAAPAAAAARAVAAANARAGDAAAAAVEARARPRLGRAWDYVAAATAVPGEAGLRRARAARAARAAAADVAEAFGGGAGAVLGFTAAPGDAALDAADAARARALLGCANLRDAAGAAPPAAAAASRDAWAESVLAAALGGRGPGPAYVALGLAEAEHARGLLHAARRRAGHGAPPFALRVVGRWDGTADGAAAAARGEDPLAPGAGLVLDAVAGRAAPDGERDATALACLQFFDVADDLSPAHAGLLLRALQRTPPAGRVRFRDAARRCRRRPRVARFGALGWLAGAAAPAPAGAGAAAAPAAAAPPGAPLRRSVAALVLDDEARVVEHRAAAAALRLRLDAAGAPAAALLRRARRAAAALRAAGGGPFDAARAGPVAAVAAAAEWLGAAPAAAADLARALDLNGDGWVAFDELAAALRRRAGGAAAGARAAGAAPYLPLPRLRPAAAAPPPRGVDGDAFAAAMARLNPWRRPGAAPPGAAALHAAAAAGAGGAAAPPRAAADAARGAADGAAAAEAAADARALVADDLRGLRVRLAAPPALEPVWSSLGTASGSPVSVWRLDGARAEGRGALRVALGDFVAPGLASPLAAAGAGAAPPAAGAGARDAAAGGPLCVELRDGATFRRRRARWLRAAAARLFPPPARYTLVWHLPGGDRAVYGWAPVPPSADFVALGHVATRTAAEPPPAAARCAHRGLCEALGPLAAVGHAPAWTNSSLGGAAGALWRARDTGAVLFARGRAAPPDGPHFRLARPQLAFADVERALGGAAADAAPGQAPAARAAPEPEPEPPAAAAAPPAAAPAADPFAADLLTLAAPAPAAPFAAPPAPADPFAAPPAPAAPFAAPPAPVDPFAAPPAPADPFDVFALAAPPPPPAAPGSPDDPFAALGRGA